MPPDRREPSRPWRILPLGDSVTTGSPDDEPGKFGPGSHGGYRPYLWSLLVADGPAFRFVGPRADGPELVAGARWDRRHAGWPGWKIADLHRGRDGQGPAARWLDALAPDLVLLLVGYNDLWFARDDAAQARAAADRLDALVADLLDHTPAPVLIGTLTPMYPSHAAAAARRGEYAATTTYNALLADIAKRRAAGRAGPVTCVDLYPAVTDPAGDLAAREGRHVSGPGYARMAAVWHRAIREVLGAPRPPA